MISTSLVKENISLYSKIKQIICTLHFPHLPLTWQACVSCLFRSLEAAAVAAGSGEGKERQEAPPKRKEEGGSKTTIQERLRNAASLFALRGREKWAVKGDLKERARS